MYGHCRPHECLPVLARETQSPPHDEAAAPPPGLAERDWSVLQELGRSDEAQVGFQGIKRRLDLHPEALRRVLDRLRRGALITKEPLGYRLTEDGLALVSRHGRHRTPQKAMPVAFLLTPSHVTPDRIVEALARRWFDGLHWYGLAEGAGERTLTWLTDSDDQPIRMRVALNGVRIEATVGDADPDERLQAAAPLVAAVAELLRGGTPMRGRSPGDPQHFAA